MIGKQATRIVRSRDGVDAVVAALMVCILLFVIFEGLQQRQPSAPPWPSHPPANIAPDPNFTSACYPHNMEARCVAQIIRATDRARSDEGLRSMVLPRDFLALAPPEQIFILSDVERVDRGLPPIVGISEAVSAFAQAGALADTDPELRAAPQGDWIVNWGSIWAADSNPLATNYDWMYNDGAGGPNDDCTRVGGTACWSHRNDILRICPTTETCGGTLVAGVAEAESADIAGWTSDAEILAVLRGPPPRLTFTWDQAVASGAK